MAIRAADFMLFCVFDGCLSTRDMELMRRPYHRNCNCALHKLKGACYMGCPQQKNILLPMKQSWKDCSVSIAVPSDSTPSQ
ncbi:hypothetical protein P3X46_035280 [Hevea brasiliensis]|uniref:Uncharacterized protein n=1 Tax=Hevea brasiliensis TaxID=3981 RepID=A0ABQ9KAG7_HEVBR|nr:hypothetical protein P3X46_035280 [Hevea brasiliensis]